MDAVDDLVQSCLTHMAALPFVRGVQVARPRERGGVPSCLTLTLETPRGAFDRRLEVIETALTEALVSRALDRLDARGDGPRWLVFAHHVPGRIAESLAERGVDSVDEAGNCNLRIGNDHTAIIEGRRPVRRPRPTPVRPSGYRVIFGLLCDSSLVDASVRAVAERTGVGKSSVGEAIERLEADGFVGRTRTGRTLLNRASLLDRWIVGYQDVLRPRLVIGRFQVRERDPARLARAVEALGCPWAWGGGVACERLTGHYRGPDLTLHLDRSPSRSGQTLLAVPDDDLRSRRRTPLPPRIGQTLRAVPDDDGPLVVVGVPGPIAFEGAVPKTVHPLLVASELLVAGDDRAREAARDVRATFLGHLS